MNDVLITKQGKVVECMAGVMHDTTCVHKFNRTLYQFITKDSGVRVHHRPETLVVESHNCLTIKQLYHVNQILHDNNIYCLITSIKGREKTRQSFRPIRKLLI